MQHSAQILRWPVMFQGLVWRRLRPLARAASGEVSGLWCRKALRRFEEQGASTHQGVGSRKVRFSSLESAANLDV